MVDRETAGLEVDDVGSLDGGKFLILAPKLVVEGLAGLDDRRTGARATRDAEGPYDADTLCRVGLSGSLSWASYCDMMTRGGAGGLVESVALGF